MHQHALLKMLEMQHRMNTRIHPNWVAQNYAWYRAIWIECGELVEHHGYKWWKAQTPDLEQVRLEVIDIWHFGLSALFRDGLTLDDLAASIEQDIAEHSVVHADILAATESLALWVLQHRSFDVGRFWDLVLAVGLDFEALYRAYVGKNVLNFFRQDHGYREGRYRKVWDGREDNEHLVDVMSDTVARDAELPEAVYEALERRYRESEPR